MSTNHDSHCRRKNRLVMITIRIKLFALPIILPIRCAHEVIEGFMDFLSLFRWAGRKAYDMLSIAEAALLVVKDYGPLDLVDVDVKSHADGRVKVKIITR